MRKFSIGIAVVLSLVLITGVGKKSVADAPKTIISVDTPGPLTQQTPYPFFSTFNISVESSITLVNGKLKWLLKWDDADQDLRFVQQSAFSDFGVTFSRFADGSIAAIHIAGLVKNKSDNKRFAILTIGLPKIWAPNNPEFFPFGILLQVYRDGQIEYQNGGWMGTSDYDGIKPDWSWTKIGAVTLGDFPGGGIIPNP